MAAKKAKSKKDLNRPRAPSARRTLAWTTAKGVFAAGLVAAVVVAIAWVGHRAGERVAHRHRYAVRAADIACDAPPGKDRATFLTEVRYKGDLPETVQSVDPGLKEKLTAAFTRHPWVAAVTGVTVTADGGVRVDLKFRTPVLAVTVADEPEPRAVDQSGILLPAVPDRAALPQLKTAVRAPTTQEGERWDNPIVYRAAFLAGRYRPRTIEKTDKGWLLVEANGKSLVVSY